MSPPPLENGISRDSCYLSFKDLSNYNKKRMNTPFICLQGRIWRLHTVWIHHFISAFVIYYSVFTFIAWRVTVVPHTHEARSIQWRKHNALNLTLLPLPANRPRLQPDHIHGALGGERPPQPDHVHVVVVAAARPAPPRPPGRALPRPHQPPRRVLNRSSGQ